MEVLAGLVSWLALSRGGMFSKLPGLLAVLGVGVVGDTGSAMFKLGGRKISFPSLVFVGASCNARVELRRIAQSCNEEYSLVAGLGSSGG